MLHNCFLTKRNPHQRTMRTLLRTTLTITVGFLFTVGVAFGQQNDAEVTQQGQDNDATLTQEHQGSQGQNFIDVYQDGASNSVDNFAQYGSGNEAILDQNGVSNTVRSNPEQGAQSGIPGGGPNGASYNGLVTVDQDGEQNTVWDLDQIGSQNTAHIRQDGEGNFADIETQYSVNDMQEGNLAEITQTGNYNVVGNNRAPGNRGIHQQGTSNELSVTQTGNENIGGMKTLSEAGITNFGPNALVGGGEQFGGRQALVQAGQGNSLTISQDGQDKVEFVLQNGVGNTGTITQLGGAASNQASLVQRGTNNTATVTQK